MSFIIVHVFTILSVVSQLHTVRTQVIRSEKPVLFGGYISMGGVSVTNVKQLA